MIRMVLLGIGFLSVTYVLLWTLGDVPNQPRGEEVSRTDTQPISLQPALNTSAAPVALAAAPSRRATAPAAVRPVARPGSERQAVDVARLRALAVDPDAAPDRAAARPDEDVMTTLRTLSYGIVSEINRPVTAGRPAGSPTAVTARAEPAAAPAPAPGRTYTVQQGDSLPGIAFRFYGTTVAYIQILSANEDILADPSKLQAGMVLRIPD